MKYKSGDIVVVCGHEDLYQIQYVHEIGCGYSMYQGRRFAHSMIERKATAKEIKAGLRNESK